MPELPEVETTVRGLRTRVLSRTFVDVWSDWKKTIKKPKSFNQFVKILKGKKIRRVWRRAKNIIFDLSDDYALLIHQKMTGHLLVGKWEKDGRTWIPQKNKKFQDPYNKFLHVIFFLDNGLMIALSDVRKFAKIELYKKEDLKKELDKLGPEPLEENFTFEKFKKILSKKKGKVKQIIMKPEVIAGIGNIYASEALFRAKINPQKDIVKLNEKELKLLYWAIQKVLLLGIKLGGESFSDYRKPDGSKGNFDIERKAYKREGEECLRCKTKIKRVKIGGRSSFFCPKCQK